MDIRRFAQDVFTDQFGKAVAETHTWVNFSEIEVGDYFLDAENTVYRKLSETLGRGQRRFVHWKEIFEFDRNEQVQKC